MSLGIEHRCSNYYADECPCQGAPSECCQDQATPHPDAAWPEGVHIQQLEGKTRGNTYFRAEVQLSESSWVSVTRDTYAEAMVWALLTAEKRDS